MFALVLCIMSITNPANRTCLVLENQFPSMQACHARGHELKDKIIEQFRNSPTIETLLCVGIDKEVDLKGTI